MATNPLTQSYTAQNSGRASLMQSARGDLAGQISDYLAQTPAKQIAGGRRNDLSSRSMALNSTRRGENKSVALEVLGGQIPRSKIDYAFEISDIVESSQKYSGKIGSTFIPSLQKPLAKTFQKDNKSDFVSSVQKANS